MKNTGFYGRDGGGGGSGRPYTRHDYRPDSRPSARPDYRPDSRPDSRPSARQDDRSYARPDYRQDARPFGRQDDRPFGRPDDRFSARPEPVVKLRPKKCAYAIIHFGSNPVYLELEIYFFMMLRQYTTHDIIYLYSVTDTPVSFVDAIRPLVTKVVPYDDRKITFDVEFKSGYANFNTLRTCNFIFAYTLTDYDTVCIIESDMVIMKPLDKIFELNAPAILTYYIGDRRLKFNDPVKNIPATVLAECKNMGRLNGGVMLINPSTHLFNTYVSKIKDVIERECKYPNETLFEYVNNSYYNLPIQFNLTHFYAKSHKLAKYGLTLSDIYVYHFNETKYKHLDIIKNPMDETGNNWLDIIQTNEKYEIKKFPIMHYKVTIFDKHHPEIKMTLDEVDMKIKGKTMVPLRPKSPSESPELPIKKPKSPSESPELPIKKPKSPSESPELPIKKPKSPSESPELPIKKPKSPSESPELPIKKPKSPSESPELPKEIIKEVLESIKENEKSNSLGSSSEGTQKRSKCPKGTRRNKKTGICEPYEKKSKCPEGTKRNQTTGNCDPIVKKSKCPKGTRRNKKTGNCEPVNE